MDYTSLLHKIENQYQRGLPFVLYSLPSDTSLTCYLQKNTSLHTTESYSEKGVIMAPFDIKEETIYFDSANSDVIETNYRAEEISLDEIEIEENEIEHSKHKTLVNRAIQAIEDKLANKIVVSRKKKINLSEVELSSIISRLLNLYPRAFNYIWYHPETGLWIGASPELLAKTDGIIFTTMALAGTKKVDANTDVKWTIKERTEQQYVTDAIVSRLQKIASALKISKTYTDLAGSLAHLRTDISGSVKNGRVPLDIIASTLHPTPAVCGTPRLYSKHFIENNEGYNREFYTGYIGPINRGIRSSQLYVNLRCMKIEGNIANLFVGGGITANSNPEAEWEETQNKLQTMLHVLKPFLN